MNKSELTEIIRKLVAEEVRNQLPALIVEVLGSKKQQITGQPVRQAPIVEVAAPVVPQRPRVNIPKTGNPALDKILAETAPGFGGQTYEPNVGVDGGFGFIGEGTVPGTMAGVDEIPSEVPMDLPFLKRDWSATLKKVDKAAAMRSGNAGPL